MRKPSCVQKDTCLSLWVCAGFAAECTAGFKNPTQLLSCKRAVLTSVPLQLLPVQPSLHTGLSEISLCTASTFANVALSQMAHMLSLTASSVSRPTSEHRASCMTSLCVDSCVMRSDFLPVFAAIVRGTRTCPAGLRSRGVNGQVFAPAVKHTRRTPSVSFCETGHCAGDLGALLLDML